jgi:hypothetical protein
MGERARERVVDHFSWSAHCAELERLLLDLRDARVAASAAAEAAP